MTCRCARGGDLDLLHFHAQGVRELGLRQLDDHGGAALALRAETQAAASTALPSILCSQTASQQYAQSHPVSCMLAVLVWWHEMNSGAKGHQDMTMVLQEGCTCAGNSLARSARGTGTSGLTWLRNIMCRMTSRTSFSSSCSWQICGMTLVSVQHGHETSAPFWCCAAFAMGAAFTASRARVSLDAHSCRQRRLGLRHRGVGLRAIQPKLHIQRPLLSGTAPE